MPARVWPLGSATYCGRALERTPALAGLWFGQLKDTAERDWGDLKSGVQSRTSRYGLCCQNCPSCGRPAECVPAPPCKVLFQGSRSKPVEPRPRGPAAVWEEVSPPGDVLSEPLRTGGPPVHSLSSSRLGSIATRGPHQVPSGVTPFPPQTRGLWLSCWGTSTGREDGAWPGTPQRHHKVPKGRGAGPWERRAPSGV